MLAPHKILVFASIFIGLIVAPSTHGQTVQDGDSIIRGDGVRVRLYGIDAPEKKSLMAERREKS